MSGPRAPSLCRGPALCVGARRSLCRGLCVGARRSWCRGPALCVGARRSFPALCVSGLGAPLPRLSLSGPAVCVSGPGAFCGGLCQGPAYSGAVCVRARRCGGARRSFVSGPGAPCVGARRSLSGVGVGPAVLSQDSFFQVPAVCVSGLALSVCLSGPNDQCVGARRSLCRGPALCLSRCDALCVGAGAGTGALCVGPRRSLCPGPGAVSGPGAPCVGARRSLCRGPVLSFESRRRGLLPIPFVTSWQSVCRAPALSVRVCVGARRSFFVSGPGALCRGPALFVSGSARRFLCRGLALCLSGPALFASGPGALYVEARHSSYQAPALSVRVCLEPRVFLYRRSALFSAPLCRGRRSPAVSPCRDPALCVGVCVGARGSPLVSGTGSLSLYRGCVTAAPIRVPPIRPGGPPVPICHPSSPARSLFPGENPKP